MSKPEVSFKVGAVRAAIFRNTLQRGSRTISIGKVILEVRYRDKDGQWKSTHSMSANEIPKAILALQKAYEYLMCRPTEDAEAEPAESVEVVHEKVR
jgi:hypothetical protein